MLSNSSSPIPRHILVSVMVAGEWLPSLIMVPFILTSVVPSPFRRRRKATEYIYALKYPLTYHNLLPFIFNKDG